MRRPFRGEMPIMLTIPLRLDNRPRARAQRRRRMLAWVFVAALAALATAVL